MSDIQDDPDDTRLELPVDQYQRYRVAYDVTRALGVTPRRVLEVGGGPGPLEAFFDASEVFISDLEGKHSGRFLISDGSRLAIADRSVDAVVTLDTLEHVPVEIRGEFLSELRRASSDLVILCAPFEGADVRAAEAAVLEFVRLRFGEGLETVRWLAEHLDRGLPDLVATAQSFVDDGWSVTTLPSGYLPNWLAVMIADHEFLATGLPHLGRLHAFYNLTVSPFDCREPSYRHFVVAARGRTADALTDAVATLRGPEDPSVGRAALAGIAGAVLAERLGNVARDGRLQGEMEGLQADMGATDLLNRDLERQLADREARIVELQGQVAALRADHGAVWSSKVKAELRRVASRVGLRPADDTESKGPKP